jgi:hypothetical protein
MLTSPAPTRVPRALRAQAADSNWSEIQDQLLEIAGQYEVLAESLERQRWPKP